MTRRFLGAIALTWALAATPALAADFPRNNSPYVAVPYGPYNWGGFYVVLNLGYQWGTVNNSAFNPSGFAGGIEGGYNWQSGTFVFGAATDLQLSGADDRFGAFKFSNPWFGTLRGRGGIAFSNVLLYVTAGLAYGGGRLEFGALSETHGHFGWTVGGGMEVALTPNWSAKAEYLYVDLTEQNYVLTALPLAVQSNVLRFGLNYRF